MYATPAQRTTSCVSGSIVGIIGLGLEKTEGVSGIEAVDLQKQLDELARELAEARGKMEEVDAVKGQFMAHVSHELRTPLNSIVGFANLLSQSKETRLGEQDLFYLGRIVGNATYLLSVVAQMLDLSAIESGKLELTLSEVHLDKLIPETIADLGGHARSDSLNITAEIPKGTRPIEADRQKLKQVLINLLANALKYTQRGSVAVRVDVDKERRPTRIDVIDTGAGIPRERLEAIFEAFDRGEQMTSQDIEGTGLGLTISRSLCAAMGYRIGVESEQGKGSTFTIYLSRHTSSAPA